MSTLGFGEAGQGMERPVNQRNSTIVKILALAIAWASTIGGGCSSFRLPAGVAELPDSHRLHIAPFSISTSFSLTKDDSLVHELVSLRGRVHETLKLPLASRQIEIFIFDDRPSYERFIHLHYPELPRRRAFFIAQDQREMVYAYRDDRLDEDLRHEVCHALLHATVGVVPLWLDEGLAEYFEVPLEANGTHERHLDELHSAMQRGWKPSLTRLENLTRVQDMNGSDYREAWAWVHFLIHGSAEGRQVLLGYLQDLRTDRCREPISARLFQVIQRPDSIFASHIEQLKPTPIEPNSISTSPAGR